MRGLATAEAQRRVQMVIDAVGTFVLLADCRLVYARVYYRALCGLKEW